MSIISFLVGIIILVIILKLLTLPFKIIIKFVINSIIGGIILAICSFFGFAIAINAGMVILTGLLGVPGFIIALIITAIL